MTARRIAPAAAAASACAWAMSSQHYTRTSAESAESAELPSYSSADVAERDGCGGRRAWVSFRGGVFDVTEFAHTRHPGGARILAAAGGAAEPFLGAWAAHWDRRDRRAPLKRGAAAAAATAPGGEGMYRLSAQTHQMMKPLRVGSLLQSDHGGAEEDEGGGAMGEMALLAQLWDDEPARNIGDGDNNSGSGVAGICSESKDAVPSGLIPVTRFPFQAEPINIPRTQHTPAHSFFVRNHASVPALQRGSFELAVEMSVGGTGTSGCRTFSMDELEGLVELSSSSSDGGGGDGGSAATSGGYRLQQEQLSATLQCTGNRLDELNAERGTTFVGWCGSKGFISNAEWRGPRLVDVLRASGVPIPGGGCGSGGGGSGGGDGSGNGEGNDEGECDDWHIEMVGADGFVVSVPWAYAADPHRPVLLATRMNNEPLPPDHGFPVRALVAGAVGARSVKWLQRIRVIRGESTSPWQRLRYRLPSSRPPLTQATAATGGDGSAAILEWPVQGIITSHDDGDVVVAAAAAALPVYGIAYSGGGREIVAVEVSGDGGASWHHAHLESQPPSQGKRGGGWGWTQWSANVPTTAQDDAAGGTVELRCRARDVTGDVQPPSLADVWTEAGYLCNAEHAIRVRLMRANETG